MQLSTFKKKHKDKFILYYGMAEGKAKTRNIVMANQIFENVYIIKTDG